MKRVANAERWLRKPNMMSKRLIFANSKASLIIEHKDISKHTTAQIRVAFLDLPLNTYSKSKSLGWKELEGVFND